MTFRSFRCAILFSFVAVTINAQEPVIPRAVMPANFDTTCAPCRDFYQYVNGGWLARTPLGHGLQEDRPIGTFGDAVGDGSIFIIDAVRAASTSMAGVSHPVTGDTTLASAKQLVGALVQRCEDRAAIDAASVTPLSSWLRRIDTSQTPTAIMTTAAALGRAGIGVMLRYGPNRRAAARVMLGTLTPDGLGLRRGALYRGTDSVARAAQSAYRAHVATVLSLLGVSHTVVEREASQVLTLETRLAAYALTEAQIGDLYATRHPMRGDSLAKLAPNIAWDAYFKAFDTPLPTTINVDVPAYLGALDTLLRTVPVATWQSYLKMRLADATYESLSQPLRAAYGAFYDVVDGVRSQGNRPTSCVTAAVSLLPDAVWRLYATADRSIDIDSTTRAITEMVTRVNKALQARLRVAPWLSKEARTYALARLDSVKAVIEYPEDRLSDYTGLVLVPDSYAEQVFAILRFNRERELAQIGHSSNYASSGVATPINAFYYGGDNAIHFPLAILAPPFFDRTMDDAVNYGIIGSIIGHELTHAITGPARGYAEPLVQQYSGYVVLDSLHVDGRLTLNENLADLGGVLASYDALETLLQHKPRPLIDGLTPEQRFFIAYANLWRQKWPPERFRKTLLVNTHAPEKWRTIGVLVNVPAFAKAFHCKPGDPMVRTDAQRVTIW